MQHEETRNRLATLTEREHIVMNLILDGKLTKQIAKKLALSVKTVESHRCHIAKKLGVDSAIQ